MPEETVRHQASCEEVYTYVYPVSLAATKRNNELIKFIPAKRVNSTGSTAVRIYEYTAAAVPVRTQGNGTPPGEVYTYVYPVSLAGAKK